MVSNYATNQQVQVLSGIRDVVDRYDTFLLDMWGVMHDGTTTYEGVLEVVSKLVAAGKEVKILSNSSKRQDNSIKMLKKLGFDPSNFSQIITSGEVAYHMLSATSPVANALAPQPWDALLESLSNNNNNNKKVFCFGSGSGDEEYFESCGWTLSTMEEADLIVARGTFTINDGENVIDKTRDGEEAYFQVYHEQIAKAAKRRIPMIVANPDKVRPDADRSPMPGTIGNAYEEALGDGSELLLKYIGKPFSDVYEIALRDQDRSRVCMVGDALETDITGAKLEGIDSIWVIKDGIHNVEIEEKGNGDLKVGCEHVLQEFNLMEDTYAKENVLFPTIVLSHFQCQTFKTKLAFVISAKTPTGGWRTYVDSSYKIAKSRRECKNERRPDIILNGYSQFRRIRNCLADSAECQSVHPSVLTLEAAQKEISALESKNTWDEVSLSEANGQKVLPGTWVFPVFMSRVSRFRFDSVIFKMTSNELASILFVVAGGTIDKDYPRSTGGYAFEFGDEPAIERLLDRLSPSFDYEVVTAFQKDSLEVTDEDRQTLAQIIEGKPQKSVIVTHGTDTMIETAQFLAKNEVLRDSRRIVLTGSMRPERFSNTDAPLNLGAAIAAVQILPEMGAYVTMHGVVRQANLATRDMSTGQFK